MFTPKSLPRLDWRALAAVAVVAWGLGQLQELALARQAELQDADDELEARRAAAEQLPDARAELARTQETLEFLERSCQALREQLRELQDAVAPGRGVPLAERVVQAWSVDDGEPAAELGQD